VTSAFVFTGSATSSADNGQQPATGIPNHVLLLRLREAGALATRIAASSGPVEERRLPPPSIDLASFNERFAGNLDTDMLVTSSRHLDQVGIDYGGLDPERPGEAAGSMRAQRQRAALSPMSVFSCDSGAALPLSDPRNVADRALMQPRPDLRSGISTGYTKLALTIAAEEGVDPNWVLSIMRAENAGFDPQLVSSTGAIGLMQVMPKIGEAFGAHDLTDPEQNIRAGTRFLRVLIDKYRNPVLIASAYNAGEPRVDAHRSLPLIRETADYVTRVVGYYTGAAESAPTPQVGRPSRPDPSPPGRIRPADRARSPMLVFSSTDVRDPVRLHQVEEANQFGSPLNIIKEEVHQ
jgi:hypothetical protein